MKCVSIHPLWAWAIVHGHKQVENRTWATSHRGPLLIHAGRSTRSDAAARAKLTALGIDVPDDVPRGAIVGRVELVDVVDYDAGQPAQRMLGEVFGDYRLAQDALAEGPKCWILRNAEPLDEPRPYAGALGLFTVPVDR